VHTNEETLPDLLPTPRRKRNHAMTRCALVDAAFYESRLLRRAVTLTLSASQSFLVYSPFLGPRSGVNISVTVLPRRRRTPSEERADLSSNVSHTQSVVHIDYVLFLQHLQSFNRYVPNSQTSFPQSAIQYLLLQFPVSPCSLKVIQ
jgi:hypothetical protein